MAAFRSYRTRQPQYPCGVNWANPLAHRNLTYLSSLRPEAYDYVRKTSGIKTATANITTPSGRATLFDGASSLIQLPTHDLSAGYPITVSCWALMSAADLFVMWSLNGTAYSSIAGKFVAGGGICFNVTSSPSILGVVAADCPIGWTHIVYIARNGTFDAYINGRQITQGVVDVNWGEPAAGNHSIGNRLNGITPRYYNSALRDFAVFGTELTPSEIASLYHNPHQLYAPINRQFLRSDLVASGAAAAYRQTRTLTGVGY